MAHTSARLGYTAPLRPRAILTDLKSSKLIHRQTESTWL